MSLFDPAGELYACLLAYPAVTLLRAPGRLPRDRQRLGGKAGERSDLALLKLAHLQSRDPGDQAQVIVRAPLPVASRPPAADLAVRARLGIGPGTWRVARIHRLFQPPAHEPVVGEVIVDPVGLEREVRPPRHDVHVDRSEALDLAQQLRVEAELEDGPRLGLARELGVERLVGPRTEIARAH